MPASNHRISKINIHPTLISVHQLQEELNYNSSRPTRHILRLSVDLQNLRGKLVLEVKRIFRRLWNSQLALILLVYREWVEAIVAGMEIPVLEDWKNIEKPHTRIFLNIFLIRKRLDNHMFSKWNQSRLIPMRSVPVTIINFRKLHINTLFQFQGQLKHLFKILRKASSWILPLLLSVKAFIIIHTLIRNLYQIRNNLLSKPQTVPQQFLTLLSTVITHMDQALCKVLTSKKSRQ